MAFPVTINGRTYTLADFEGTNYVDGFPDALEDFVTQAGDIYNSTSTSSVAIGTGSKSFTTADSDKPYQVGTPLRIADAANPETNFMDCIVTSYSGTSLVVDAFGFAGSGTISSWTINIGGAKTVDGTLAVNQGGTGATTASAARTNLGLGSIATQDADSVNIDGGAIDGVTLGTNSAVSSAVITTADINGGTIDGVTIGGASAGAATFTSFTSNGIDDNADSTVITLDSDEDAIIGTATKTHNAKLTVRKTGGVNTTIAAWTDGANSTGKLSIRSSATVGIGSDGALAFSTGEVGVDTFNEQMRLTAAGNLLFNSGYGSVQQAYGVRAWMQFGGTGTVSISASGNISSVSDNGTGDYTATFSSSMPDDNYAVNVSAVSSNNNGTGRVISILRESAAVSAGNFRISGISTADGTTYGDLPEVYATVVR